VGGEARGAPTAKRAAVQAAVLEATAALLTEGTSYPELKIERIATRAGISRTAFYFYFRDKRELLLRLTEDVAERLYAEGDIWFSGDGDPAEELSRAVRNNIALYSEHGAVLRAIVDASPADPELARFWQGIMDRFVQATQQRIEEEQHTGRAAGVDPLATAFALCWMTERVVHQQFVLGEPFSQDELVEAITAIWVRSIYAG
jgi:TetR/AcrR family transcriptional regulator, ethionamide resistance regulator